MRTIETILCPVDFSEPSRLALQHAGAVAKWYGAALHLLHVHARTPIPAGPPEVMPVLVMTREQREQLDEALGRMATDEVAPGVQTEIAIAEGRADREIVERAGAMKADLIVMGTHGASGVERLLLGSVTEKVLRRAPCPVMTVPPRTPDAVPLPPLFKRILCPVDFSSCSRAALTYALSFAREADAELTIAHVFELEGTLGENWREKLTPRSVREELLELERDRQDKLAHVVPPDADTYCRIDTVMRRGTPYEEVLRLAAERHSELIVIGVHGRSAAEMFFFGSTTTQIVRHATCPVLTVRG
jgi:nucleotide-binding universal stress UspA family protein